VIDVPGASRATAATALGFLLTAVIGIILGPLGLVVLTRRSAWTWPIHE
jgi:hypothetical protein